MFSAPIVAPVDTETGKGHVASRNYKRGDRVCECFGQLIPRATVDGRLEEYGRLNLSYMFIHVAGAHGFEALVLDGHRNEQGDLIDPNSNLGATMNHSRDSSNCRMTRVMGMRGERPRFWIVTTTGISAGAEMRLEYGDFRRGVEGFINHWEFGRR
ncbi:histone-lysine N-methyltransferase Set8-like [Haliotis asinina]|uniref:histone-lysine N-methyltransferase Set8-like n=1 Tax=Haliotis asinina TaxID=109174 RepID=UPI003531FD45